MHTFKKMMSHGKTINSFVEDKGLDNCHVTCFSLNYYTLDAYQPALQDFHT